MSKNAPEVRLGQLEKHLARSSVNEIVLPGSDGRSPAGSRMPPSHGDGGTADPLAMAPEIVPTTFAVPDSGALMLCLGTEVPMAYQRPPMSTQPPALAGSPGPAFRCGRQKTSVTVDAFTGAVGTVICTPPSSRRVPRSWTPSLS